MTKIDIEIIVWTKIEQVWIKKVKAL